MIPGETGNWRPNETAHAQDEGETARQLMAAAHMQAELGLSTEPADRRAISIEHLQQKHPRQPNDDRKQRDGENAQEAAPNHQPAWTETVHQGAAVNGEEKGQDVPGADDEADGRRRGILAMQPQRQDDACDIVQAVGKKACQIDRNLNTPGDVRLGRRGRGLRSRVDFFLRRPAIMAPALSVFVLVAWRSSVKLSVPAPGGALDICSSKAFKIIHIILIL